MSKSGQTDGAVSSVGSKNIPHMVKNSPRLRVLVVDDEPLIRWSLAQTLEQSGHAVVEAGDAQSAIRWVSSSGPFDVVLLDYRLPDSNDLNLLATIRKLSPAAAVIMMTAFGTPEVMTGALQLGAYQVIPKPFEVHEVAAPFSRPTRRRTRTGRVATGHQPHVVLETNPSSVDSITPLMVESYLRSRQRVRISGGAERFSNLGVRR